jgi:type IV fimbrial biogenesis protein FimT
MARTHGFTVIELMVTIVLAAILVAVAAPSLQNMLQNNRAAAIANDLITSLRFARSEAVTRAQNITLCPSSDGTSCVNTTSWASGWIIRDAAGTALRRYPAITQTASGSSLTGTRSTLVFTSTGFQTSTDFSFNLVIPNCRRDNNRRVVVNPQGRPEVVKVQC